MYSLEALEAESIYRAKKEFNDAVDRESEKTPEERSLGGQDQAKTTSSPNKENKNFLQKYFIKDNFKGGL